MHLLDWSLGPSELQSVHLVLEDAICSLLHRYAPVSSAQKSVPISSDVQNIFSAQDIHQYKGINTIINLVSGHMPITKRIKSFKSNFREQNCQRRIFYNFTSLYKAVKTVSSRMGNLNKSIMENWYLLQYKTNCRRRSILKRQTLN